VTCHQLEREAAERPKSLRLLPKITADAVRLVWAANLRMLVPSIGLKVVNGAGLAIALIFGKNLIGSVLSADTGSAATAPGIGAVAPQLPLLGEGWRRLIHGPDPTPGRPPVAIASAARRCCYCCSYVKKLMV